MGNGTAVGCAMGRGSHPGIETPLPEQEWTGRYYRSLGYVPKVTNAALR